MQPLSFSEAALKLARHNIRREQIYFIDMVLLAEMAWADSKIQSAEKELLFTYLNRHVDSINRLAGCSIVGQDEARKFVEGLLAERPLPEMVETVEEVIPAVRIQNKKPEIAEKIKLDILNACLDIAASSVTHYPYGLTERFTQEEKDYYHKIEKILTGERTVRF